MQKTDRLHVKKRLDDKKLNINNTICTCSTNHKGVRPHPPQGTKHRLKGELEDWSEGWGGGWGQNHWDAPDSRSQTNKTHSWDEVLPTDSKTSLENHYVCVFWHLMLHLLKGWPCLQNSTVHHCCMSQLQYESSSLINNTIEQASLHPSTAGFQQLYYAPTPSHDLILLARFIDADRNNHADSAKKYVLVI